MLKRWRTSRVVLGAAGFLLMTGGLSCGLFYYLTYCANAAVQQVSLPTQPAPSRGSRILVVAPHCDDETLGVGGYLSQAARAGAHVRIVLVTNGDGFALAASKQYLRLLPSPEMYMKLAYLRQEETRAALRRLGVAPESVVFLGYPDGGLSQLWNNHWSASNPYTSAYTRKSHSPYANSYRPGAAYCGEALLTDLTRIIEEERPTELFVPDPGDDHPDHWATHCFAVSALESIRTRKQGEAGARLVRHLARGPVVRTAASTGPVDWSPGVLVRTYLIHRGDWPVPQGLHESARLVPPAALLHLDTRWQEVLLTPEDRQRKKDAILSYRSQTAVIGRFMSSFARKDELFGTIPPAHVRSVPELASLDDQGLPREWAPGGGEMRDASKDTLLRRLDGSADLERLDAVTDGSYLYLRLTARKPLSDRTRYRLYLHPIGQDGQPLAPVTAELSVSSGTAGMRVHKRDREWRVGIPLSRLGSPSRIIVGAETQISAVVLDRISWRVLVLPAPRHGSGVTAARSPVGRRRGPRRSAAGLQAVGSA